MKTSVAFGKVNGPVLKVESGGAGKRIHDMRGVTPALGEPAPSDHTCITCARFKFVLDAIRADRDFYRAMTILFLVLNAILFVMLGVK